MHTPEFTMAFMALFTFAAHVTPVTGICCQGSRPMNRALCDDLTAGTPCCGYGKCNIFCCACDLGCRTDPMITTMDKIRWTLPCRTGGSRCPWAQWSYEDQVNHGERRSVGVEVDDAPAHDPNWYVIEDHKPDYANGHIGEHGENRRDINLQPKDEKEDCVKTKFAAADTNKDGKLDFNEYMKFMEIDKPQLAKRTVRNWESYYRSFDLDNKGHITLEDITALNSTQNITSPAIKEHRSASPGTEAIRSFPYFALHQAEELDQVAPEALDLATPTLVPNKETLLPSTDQPSYMPEHRQGDDGGFGKRSVSVLEKRKKRKINPLAFIPIILGAITAIWSVPPQIIAHKDKKADIAAYAKVGLKRPDENPPYQNSIEKCFGHNKCHIRNGIIEKKKIWKTPELQGMTKLRMGDVKLPFELKLVDGEIVGDALEILRPLPPIKRDEISVVDANATSVNITDVITDSAIDAVIDADEDANAFTEFIAQAIANATLDADFDTDAVTDAVSQAISNATTDAATDRNVVVTWSA